jgi:hypothetical protein
MKHYNKYLVSLSDGFNSANYPLVGNEISTIKEKTDSFPNRFKVEIIISFLKSHSLQNDWIKANPPLTELITSGVLFTGDIESLFDSCLGNKTFRGDLEVYLKKNLQDISPGATDDKVKEAHITADG